MTSAESKISARRVRYAVAASLDGYIAGPGGEFDWIPMDPDIDFRGLFDRFDTILMGRRTFEGLKGGDGGGAPEMKTFVFSRSLRQDDHPNVTIVSDDVESTMRSLRAAPGKDIWLGVREDRDRFAGVRSGPRDRASGAQFTGGLAQPAPPMRREERLPIRAGAAGLNTSCSGPPQPAFIP